MLNGALPEGGKAAHDCEVLLTVKGDGARVELPFLAIQIVEYSAHGVEGSLTQNDIAILLKSIKALDSEKLTREANRRMSDEMQSVTSDIAAHGASLDEESMVYRFSTQGETAMAEKYVGGGVGYVGRYAIVQLIFYCVESDWSRFENQRSLMFDSFSFYEGMRYKDAPSRLGWGTVTHVAYSLVAAVLGLVFVFPKLVSDNRESDELKRRINSRRLHGGPVRFKA
jgi:hypothetical protein